MTALREIEARLYKHAFVRFLPAFAQACILTILLLEQEPVEVSCVVPSLLQKISHRDIGYVERLLLFFRTDLEFF